MLEKLYVTSFQFKGKTKTDKILTTLDVWIHTDITLHSVTMQKSARGVITPVQYGHIMIDFFAVSKKSLPLGLCSRCGCNSK